MAIFNRRKTLTEAVIDWSERDLIDQSTANTLLDDISSQIKARSFSSIVMLLGVICLAFGVMTFVAANWDAMSSIARVCLLITGLWASWAISIALKIRGKDWASQIFVMLACGILALASCSSVKFITFKANPKMLFGFGQWERD